MIAIQLQLLFSACLVTRPLLPHTFPVPLSSKVEGFVWWLVVKGASGPLPASGSAGCSWWCFPLPDYKTAWDHICAFF